MYETHSGAGHRKRLVLPETGDLRSFTDVTGAARENGVSLDGHSPKNRCLSRFPL